MDYAFYLSHWTPFQKNSVLTLLGVASKIRIYCRECGFERFVPRAAFDVELKCF